MTRKARWGSVEARTTHSRQAMPLITPQIQTDVLPTRSEDETSALEQFFSFGDLRGQLEAIWFWLRDNIFQTIVLIELGLVAIAFTLAALVAPIVKKRIDRHLTPRAPEGIARRGAHALGVIAGPIMFFVLLNVASLGMQVAGQPRSWIAAGISLSLAWIVIRLVTLVIRSRFWSQVAFYIVWPIAALDVFGVLNDIIMYLDSAAIPLGTDAAGVPRDLSMLDVLRGFMAFVVFFWLANVLATFLAKRVYEIEDLTPSLRALIVKILNILMPVLAFFLALQLIGVNLAALAVFSGAVGLGVGLGLQKSVSNLISGFTLIADKSIKPGDVVSVDETFGWVTAMGARYVSVRTRDGTEHLVPNDTFIQEGVVNWSHADKVVRLHAPIGVAYGTKDLRLVQQLCMDAVKDVERVLDFPKPICNLMEFGDSSIDFDLRFWIKDPENGMANVRSEVYMNIVDAFHANGIEIPFPQRDLHLRSVSEEAAAALPLRPASD